MKKTNSRRKNFWSSFALLGSAALSSCSGGTQIVPHGPHRPEQKAVRVDEPTPPARVERVPLRQNSQCRWLDGYWERSRRNWQWVKGRWVLPPKGCYFAPPQTLFELEDVGLVLNYRPGVWYPQSGTEVCVTEKSCTNASP